MKILAFGTSNNAHSINRTLAAYAASLVEGATVEVLNIHDYEMPIFSDAREDDLGQPPQAKAFLAKISEADALVIAFAEHNGSYSAAWKNLFDWTSRITRHVFQHKPAVFLATSPGPGGAVRVLASAVKSASHFGADVITSMSVPSFHENFNAARGKLSNAVYAQNLQQAMDRLSHVHAQTAVKPVEVA
jgi:NAD(P)H-dependent FMN reductase